MLFIYGYIYCVYCICCLFIAYIVHMVHMIHILQHIVNLLHILHLFSICCIYSQYCPYGLYMSPYMALKLISTKVKIVHTLSRCTVPRRFGLSLKSMLAYLCSKNLWKHVLGKVYLLLVPCTQCLRRACNPWINRISQWSC